MYRGTLLSWGLLGLAGLGGCLASVFATGEQKSERLNPNGWRLLEPVIYENLSVFPVVSHQGVDTGGFVTLDEALASGDAQVTERGGDVLRRTRDGRPVTLPYPGGGASVNQLVLINRSNKPLVLLAGELISGGKQDRVIAKDRIVAPGAEPLPLDVFCVEHGRWSAGTQFASAKIIVHPSVREKAAVDQKQTEVWAAVRGGTTARVSGDTAPAAAPQITVQNLDAAIAGEARTESYARLYKTSSVGSRVEPFAEEVQRRFARATANLKGERVVGVVVAYGGEVAWSDIFASPALFDRYWSKLLRSYVVEAMARPQSKEHASLDDAREFLRPLEGRENIESEPNVYRWRQVTQGHYAEIELEALRPKNITLHHLKIHRTS
ncbi:MAG: hypothetical protein DMG28_06585 [Acidobacteria bacterium]|nr:MAG: hypothetical protein DMG28_06585 [Acidobacteriota bacterium]